MSDLRDREFNSLKILHHIDRLQVLAAGKDIAPVTVEIDPVSYCNHGCAWCVDPMHHAARMTEETFESLITELATFEVNGFGVEGIVFKGGGEPTLHPAFGRMVTRTVALGFAVGVVTNGSRLVEWADVLANNGAYVRVSIDGPTPESHYHVHRSRDFEHILAGVEQLIAARGERRHPIVGLSFAMDVQTADLAEEAVRLGERLGVNYILLRPPFFEEVGSEPTMTTAQAQAVRKQLQAVAGAYAGEMDILVGNWIGDVEQAQAATQLLEASGRRAMHAADARPIEHRTGRCLASPMLAVITADGTLYGCCNLRALERWSFGRLDYESGVGLRALWAGTQRRDVLAAMHRTACIEHCTHPLARYNEMIEVLGDEERLHFQFV